VGQFIGIRRLGYSWFICFKRILEDDFQLIECSIIFDRGGHPHFFIKCCIWKISFSSPGLFYGKDNFDPNDI